MASVNRKIDGLHVRVAWYYYKSDMTQEDIARRLGINRARVIKILEQCRNEGIISFHVKEKPPAGAFIHAARQSPGVLMRKYSLYCLCRYPFKAAELHYQADTCIFRRFFPVSKSLIRQKGLENYLYPYRCSSSFKHSKLCLYKISLWPGAIRISRKCL